MGGLRQSRNTNAKGIYAWFAFSITCALLTIVAAALLILSQKRLEELQKGSIVAEEKAQSAVTAQLKAVQDELKSTKLRLKAEKATNASIRRKLIEAKKALSSASPAQKEKEKAGPPVQVVNEKPASEPPKPVGSASKDDKPAAKSADSPSADQGQVSAINPTAAPTSP
jgi:hypothetical protein